ncbi:MAG: hypothetical protein HFF62_05350 [Oscillospiraceae bacterium]|nr:hypothetical protein [Oscillospiraceae bacterium]
MNNSFSRMNRDTRRKIAIGAGLLALLLICGIAGFRFFSGKTQSAAKPNGPTTGIAYDQNAEEGGWSALSEEEIAASLNSKVEEGMINISMNTSPVFPNAKSEGNLMIVNELVNTYPQRVELIRNDTDEVIYSSAAIAVGSKIASAKLDVELPAGTYECTAMFHSLDPETGAVLGTAGAVVTVTVQA